MRIRAAPSLHSSGESSLRRTGDAHDDPLRPSPLVKRSHDWAVATALRGFRDHLAAPGRGVRLTHYDEPMPEIPVGEPLRDAGSGSRRAPSKRWRRQLRSTTWPQVAAEHPSCLAAWASLGEQAMEDGSPVAAYAYFRVGYHRGLDTDQTGRLAGGKGSVPWGHEEDRGCLRSLKGLGVAAGSIGENGRSRTLRDLLPGSRSRRTLMESRGDHEHLEPARPASEEAPPSQVPGARRLVPDRGHRARAPRGRA